MAEPKAFGRYLLLDRVAFGGMAEIYTAKSFGADGFDRLLAIKRVLPSVADDDQFVEMFKDEAKITRALNHGNIVQVTDFGKIEGSYYLAMEYISGKDLKALWGQAATSGDHLDPILVAYIVASLAEGLSYAHNATDATGKALGVIHRDVTPQNVLISWDGEVKLVDFGIAKARAKSLKTEVGVLKGKFAYMSPEQVRGLPLTKKTDIFSLGTVLYELLTSERAFDQETDYAIMESVRRVDIVDPAVHNPEAPDELVRICAKAMSYSEEERYVDGEHMARDLRTWIASTGRNVGRLELASFLKSSFPNDFREERSRLTRYAQVKPDALANATENAPIREAGTSTKKVTTVRLGVATGSLPKVPMTTGTAPLGGQTLPSSTPKREKKNWLPMLVFILMALISSMMGLRAYQWWQSRPGVLEISTRPAVVEVFINDVFAGVTSPGPDGRGLFASQRPRGDLKVLLRAAGYKDNSEALTLVAGEVFKLAPDLAPDIPTLGHLDLVVYPPHATVMDGENPLPLSEGRGRLSLEEGRTKELKIRANNHEPQNVIVGPVTPGETVEQEIRLALSRWLLKVTPNPADAKVEARVGDRTKRSVGITELRGLHPGETVRVKVSGRRCRSKRLRVQSDGLEIVERTVQLRCRKR
ncbi:MAG: serine/threonine-protein kinase [Myxococcota bacterium]|nr:serine/threonine-protein kinase [Myxococcota bacterium]